ncbi:MAG: XdhC family protein, partial [Coriobacteriales bacterium]|nr:XdhC family protein [Coriobacteriales bacterium]
PSCEDLGITKDDMVCVITRGHTYDPQSFTYALKTPAFYVGMMGSAKKNAKVFQYAREHGCTPDQVESAYAPIGESIGAIDASEIGLAIVAQLVHVHNDRYFREKDHDSLHRD